MMAIKVMFFLAFMTCLHAFTLLMPNKAHERGFYPLKRAERAHKPPRERTMMSLLDWPSIALNSRGLVSPFVQPMDIFDLLDMPLHALPQSTMGASASTVPRMSIDVRETDSSYEILCDVPGVMKDDVKIDVKDRMLTISSERTHMYMDSNEPQDASVNLGTDGKPKAKDLSSAGATQTRSSSTTDATETTLEPSPESERAPPTLTGTNEGAWRRIERSYGAVSRSLSVPKDADVTGIEASLEHGVLTVVIPKLPASVSETMQVHIKQ